VATITDLIPEAQKHGKAVMQGTWAGIVASNPAGFDKQIYVIIPDISRDHKWGPCNWQAKDNVTLPQVGDQALVVFDNRRAPWVTAFWSGTRHPSRTTRPLSSGPPPNPIDGDVWVADTGDGLGTRWQFQYNASSSSSYKWEFIGGSPLYNGSAYTASDGSCNSVNTWVGVGPTISIPRAGEYDVNVRTSLIRNGGSPGNNVYVGAGRPVTLSVLRSWAVQSCMDAYANHVDAYTAGYLAQTYLYCDTSAGVDAYDSQIRVLPKRIS